MAKKLFAAVALSFLISLQAHANIINAASPEIADVRAAIAQAAQGDTVVLPAGTAHYTEQLTVSVGITLQGQTTTANAGTASASAFDQTVIIDDGITNTYVIEFNTDGPYRLTGITLRGGASNPANTNAALGLSNDTGRLNPAIRVDNCHFDMLRRRAVWQDGWMYGVINENVFHINGAHEPFYFTQPRWNGEDFGNGSWADFPYFGSGKFVFAEDNTLYGDGGGVDNMNGGRWVMRHNFFQNCVISGHGTESGPQRGNRADMWYNNIFDFTDGSRNNGQRRSGNEIVHDNAWIDFPPQTPTIPLALYRENMRGELWGMAQGTNEWDANDTEGDGRYVEGNPPYLFDSGTVAAVTVGVPPSTRVLSVPGKNWTQHQWTGFSITNTTSAHAYLGILIKDNTADTIQIYTNYASDVAQSDWVVFHPGDNFSIHRVLRALDQPGTGKGDLVRIVGDVPVNQVTGRQHSWPHPTSEPCFSWNNVLTRTGAAIGFDNVHDVSIRAGRDFFNLGAGFPPNAIPPQVTAAYPASINGGAPYDHDYQYPHPLRTGASPTPTATATSTPTSTPSGTPTVSGLTYNGGTPFINGTNLTSGRSYTVTAQANANTRSVTFKRDGALVNIDSAAPFAFRWTPTVLGNHTFAATPWSSPNGTGTSGATVTVTFTVVAASPTPTATPNVTPTPTPTATPTVTPTPTPTPTATPHGHRRRHLP